MRANPINILLIDDHPILRKALSVLLSMMDGLVVTGEANSKKEALLLCNQKEFDIALLDIELPDSSGLDLLISLHSNHPKMKILVFSTYQEDLYAERALKCGASGYLTKDSPSEELLLAIRKVKNGGRYISPNLAEKLATKSVGSESQQIKSFDGLSNREITVFTQIARGVTLVEIAKMININATTITTYRARILTKLGLKNNSDITRYAIENKLL